MLANNVPNNMPRNPTFYSFVSFSIVSLIPFINKLASSRDLIIIMRSFISSFVIISLVLPDPKIFFWIVASVADADTLSLNGIEALLANGFIVFFIKGELVFSNRPKILPRNPLDCHILERWAFDNFILDRKPFAKVLWSLKTCVVANYNLCGKLISSLESPNKFDKRFKVTVMPFFIPDFNLLICKLEKFTFKVLYSVNWY